MDLGITNMEENLEAIRAFYLRAVKAKDQHLAPYYFDKLKAYEKKIDARKKLLESIREYKRMG